MAISGVDPSAAEQERYSRSLREREANHAKEVSTLQDRQRRALSRLEEEQKKTLGEIETKGRDRLEKQVEAHQQITEKLGDRFEKTRNADRREYYDRFGRSAESFNNEIQGSKSASQEQIKGLVSSHEQEKEHLKRATDETIYGVRRETEKQLAKHQDGAKEHMNSQSGAFQKEMNNLSKENRNKLDTRMRENFDEMRKQKMASEERLDNVYNQQQNLQKNMSNAFNLREKQLVDEKNFREQQVNENGMKALDDNRAKLGENLDRVSRDNQFYNAKKDMNFSNSLSQQSHENQLKLQDQRMAYERMLLGEKGQADARQDRERTGNELLRRQMAYENHLAHEGVKSNYEDVIRDIKESNSMNSQEQNLKHQTEYDDLKRNFQKRTASLEKDRSTDTQEKQFHAMEKAREEQMQHLRQRQQMAHEFRIAHEAQDSTLKRHKGETDEYYHKRMQEHQKATAETVAQNNAENQFKLSKQKSYFEGINSQIEKEKQNSTALQEQMQRSQMGRVSQNYKESLIDVDKMHKAQTNEMRHNFTETIEKTRNEDDTRLKDMASDYEFRIRVMASDYENKISDMTSAHAREVNQMKRESEIQKRDVSIRAKAELENLQESHKKEMALQENQFKERFRLTKMNNEQELARVKRSNELLAKKS